MKNHLVVAPKGGLKEPSILRIFRITATMGVMVLLLVGGISYFSKTIQQNLVYVDNPNDFAEHTEFTNKWVLSADAIKTGSMVFIIERPGLVIVIPETSLYGKFYVSSYYFDGAHFRDRHTNKQEDYKTVIWDKNQWEKFSKKHVLFFSRKE